MTTPAHRRFNDCVGRFYAERETGRFARAERAALAATHAAYGSDPPIIALTLLLNSLAGMLESQRRYAEAERYYLQATALCANNLDSNDSNLCISILKLTDMFRTQGQHDAAASWLRYLLATQKLSHDVDHSKPYFDMRGYLTRQLRQDAAHISLQARTLMDEGHYRDAEPLCRLALALAEEVHDGNPRPIGVRLDDLGQLLRARGLPEKAEPFLRRSLAIKEQVFGIYHPQTARATSNLAGALREQGRITEAESLYRQAFAILARTLGADHPEATTSLNPLIDLLRTQGRHTETVVLFRQVMSAWHQVLDSERRAGGRNQSSTVPTTAGRLGGASGLEPLIPGDWHPLPAFGQKRILDQLKRQMAGVSRAPRGQLAQLSALTLPFYRHAVLYEGEIESAPKRYGRWAFIRCRQKLTVLDGTAEPLLALNAAAPLVLETTAQVMAYLRFHGAVLERVSGASRIVQQPGDLPGLAEIEAALRHTVERALRPLTVARTSDSAWRAAGVVLYGQRLWAVSWRVARDGRVAIVDEQPRCDELPIASWRFRGMVRHTG